MSVSYGASIMEINAMIVNIARLLKLLEWSGVHARTLLPVGVIVAFFSLKRGRRPDCVGIPGPRHTEPFASGTNHQ